MSEYEEILRDLHQFGSFQKRVFILVSFFDLPSAWSMILPVFVGANPGWTCPVAGNFSDDENLTTNSLNVTTDTCSADGSMCDGFSFNKDFTSILTEVSMFIVLLSRLPENLMGVITILYDVSVSNNTLYCFVDPLFNVPLISNFDYTC